MNNNPKGNNQYTKKDGKQGQQKKSTGNEKMSMSGEDKQADGRKGHANNPEGHNQYTNKAK